MRRQGDASPAGHHRPTAAAGSADGGAPIALSPTVFRERVAELLRSIESTEEGRLVAALAAYGRRLLEGDRSAGPGAAGPSEKLGDAGR